MSDHVSLELADFLEDRLTPSRRGELEAHLEGCPECAAELAFARHFRESALAQGLMHLRPERIVELAGSSGEPTDAERVHLDACDVCRGEMHWAESGPTADDPGSDAGDPPAPGNSRRPLFRLWIPAAAAIAALLAVFITLVAPRLRTGGPEFADLILAEPLPVRINRSAAPPDSFATARLLGLESYQDGNYALARDRFREALGVRPEDAEMLLYSGSTELLLGDAATAATHLEAGLRTAGSDALRAELAWQLADALLEQGDRDGARRALTRVIELGRSHAADAERVLTELP